MALITPNVIKIVVVIVAALVPAVTSENEVPFPCTAPEFNTSAGYMPTPPKQDLTMLNLAADAFEKWLNNGQNKSISCAPETIGGYGVNVTNSCIKVLEEGTSYALEFKSKFECLSPMLSQVSANVLLQAQAYRPNVTIAGKKPAPVISSVRFLDGVEFDRVVIQEVVVRQLAPAPGPMMKEIQDSIQKDLASQKLIPLSGSPKAAPGPSASGAMQSQAGNAMFPMPLPVVNMADLASAQRGSDLAGLLNQASFQPLSLQSSDEESDDSGAASGMVSALADVLSSLAQRSTGRQSSRLSAVTSLSPSEGTDDEQDALNDKALVMAANQPLRAERVSQRPNPYLIAQQLANQDMSASRSSSSSSTSSSSTSAAAAVSDTSRAAITEAERSPEHAAPIDWSAQVYPQTVPAAQSSSSISSRTQRLSSVDSGTRRLLSA
eukprot:jgi/Botrbrau1/19798/Bobra.0124s0046.1